MVPSLISHPTGLSTSPTQPSIGTHQRDPYNGYEHQFTDQDRDNIIIEQHRMYEHKTIRFKSTTYNARRIEESANLWTHADVMVLSHEDGVDDRPAFPYWHARICRDLLLRTRQLCSVTRLERLPQH